jgi:glycosyltransferase involved in cell wall biosynthesis
LTGGGGASEALLDGETGCFVQQPDAQAIADAVLGLVHDRSRRARFADAGAQFARSRFAVGRMLAETLRLYGPDVTASAPALEEVSAPATGPPAIG